MFRAPLIGLALLALAGGAQAQTALIQSPAPNVSKPMLDLSRAPRLTPYSEVSALRAAGLARTSLDRRLSGDDAVASVGFLCGLQPSQDRSGAGKAYGDDPHGRFLGAKLSRAF